MPGTWTACPQRGLPGQGNAATLPRLLGLTLPGLLAGTYVRTSPRSGRYNCIAWAADDQGRNWWCNRRFAYWPDGAPEEHTLAAFEAAFATRGYERCPDSSLEAGVEKVAIFADARGPQHAARQLEDGRWTSKLGKGIDVTHELGTLEGGIYGSVACYLSRPRVEGRSGG